MNLRLWFFMFAIALLPLVPSALYAQNAPASRESPPQIAQVAIASAETTGNPEAPEKAHKPMISATRYGLYGGSVGFSIGFFGPMIFAPGAAQGPLLGIFITGPLGFLIGLTGGWLYNQFAYE